MILDLTFIKESGSIFHRLPATFLVFKTHNSLLAGTGWMDEFEQLECKGNYWQILQLTETTQDEGTKLYWRTKAILELGIDENELTEFDPSKIDKDHELKTKASLLHTHILLNTGKYTEAAEFLGNFLKKDANNDDLVDLVRRYWLLGKISQKRVNYSKAQKHFNESLSLARSISNKLLELENEYALADLLLEQGNFERVEEFCTQIFDKLDTFDNPHIRIKYLNLYGLTLRNIGKLDEAKSKFEEALILAEENNYPRLYCVVLNGLGIYYTDIGKLYKAMECYNKIINFEYPVNPVIRYTVFNNIGLIYTMQGEIEKAHQHFKKYKGLAEKRDDIIHAATAYVNLAETYLKLGDIDEAIRYSRKSLEIETKIGNPLYIAESLLNLIKYNTIVGITTLAETYLQQLAELREDSNTKLINQYFDFARAYILQASKRGRKKFEAIAIFEKLIEDRTLEFKYRIDSLAHLIELLIFEYRSLEEEQIMEDITDNINLLYNLAQDQYLYATVVDVLILKARLALLNRDFEMSETLLEQAALVAEEQNMSRYKQKVEQEQERIERDLLDLKDSFEESNFAERLEMSRLVDYIRKVQSRAG